ncbi:MAG: type II secretion system protein GspC [Cellvibrionales bacterium]|nr:type II secretion system protein GspC [Cellvibrionales bacterium]
MSHPTVAKLSALSVQVTEQVSRLPQDKCRTALMVGIIFIVITILGNNFWFFFAYDEVALPEISSRPTKTSHTNKQVINYEDVKSWQLFGEEPKASTEEAETILPQVTEEVDENARETNLNLRLVGIINASDPQEGYAIIQHGSEANLYKVGDPIPVGNDISLAKVLVDRVIINNRGNFESLKLFESDKKLPVKRNIRKGPAKALKTLDKRNDQRVTQLMTGYRKQLLSNPMSMANVIRVSLATDAEGNTIGYRVRPGKARKEFAELGLKSGDIITAVNGISLSDQQSAMQLYGSLGSLTEANFDIKRGNSHLSILVNLSN